jgi:hypothetical protein
MNHELSSSSLLRKSHIAEPISNGTTMQLTLLALGKTGVHSHTIETWYNKDNANHTWPIFLLHFNKYGRTCINKMTAQAAGFHGAQNATRIPPDDQANTAATQQAGKSKDLFVSDGTPLFYCWSHGLSKTSEHTSKTCNNQGEGHCVNSRTASHASARAQRAPLHAH